MGESMSGPCEIISSEELPQEVCRSIKSIYRKNWAARIACVHLSLGELEDLTLAYAAPWRSVRFPLPWRTAGHIPPWRPVGLSDIMRKEISNLRVYSRHLSSAYEGCDAFTLPKELEDLKEPVSDMQASLSILEKKIDELNGGAEELFAAGLLEKYLKKKGVLLSIKMISYVFDTQVLSAGKRIGENPYFKAFHKDREKLGCRYIGE